jgi:phage-related protein
MKDQKPIQFLGNSLSDLRDFPVSAKQQAGYQLHRVQEGNDPDNWKPMTSIGSGVKEIRIRDDNGAFRIIYVAKFKKAIYVLHCFQKKTQRTPQSDLAIASQRYKDIEKEQQP